MSVVYHNAEQSYTKFNQIPCTSKRKSNSTEIVDCKKATKCMKTIENCVHSLWSLVPVLSDEYQQGIQTVQVFVGKVVDKKQTSRLLKEVCSRWPLPQMHHLKRVRRTGNHGPFDIILRPVGPDDEISTKEILLNNVIKYSLATSSSFCTEGLSSSVMIYAVPKNPPMTSSQYKESMLLWPVQYREDKYIERILNDELFENQEKRNMEKYMTLAINVAKHGKMQIGAVIVDPSSEKVIAIAYDRRHIHPLQHTVMVGIDLVAKSQGGGAWHYDEDPFLYSLPYSEVPGISPPEEQNNEGVKPDAKKLSLPYICTSFDLYVSREPCVMCSMALVHSRIRRVFYGQEMPHGALGSHYKIHVQPGLNHHYEVWKGVLRKECSLLNTSHSVSKNDDL